MTFPRRWLYSFCAIIVTIQLLAFVPTVLANQLPQISPIGEKHVYSGERVHIRASASDGDGQSLAFHWEQTTGPALERLRGINTDTLIFTAPDVATLTQLDFLLAVSDGVATSEQIVTVMVQEQLEKKPLAHAGIDQSVSSNQIVTLNGSSSSDQDSIALTFFWQQLSGPEVHFSPTHAQTTFIAPHVSEASELRFQLTVNDGKNEAGDEVVVHVLPESIVPLTTVAPPIPSAPTSPIAISTPQIVPALLFIDAPVTVRVGEKVPLKSSFIDPEANYFWRVANHPLVVNDLYEAETSLTIPSDFISGHEIILELVVTNKTDTIRKQHTMLVIGDTASKETAIIKQAKTAGGNVSSVGVSLPSSISAEPAALAVDPVGQQVEVSSNNNSSQASLVQKPNMFEPKMMITVILVLVGMLCVSFALLFRRKEPAKSLVTSSHTFLYDRRK
ncbi:MAG: hypothetical protein HY817_05885 [Candidatus Abawacabacteria bacterium]|nr:hypothetical protein [Candidatus Abawacabacteria bacterium]